MSENQSSNKTLTIVLGILCLILAGTTAYFANKAMNPQKSIEYVQLKDEKDKTETVYQTTLNNLNSTSEQLETMKGKNVELDALIKEREEKIGALTSQLTTINKKANKTDADRAKMQTIIDELQKQNADYIAQINTLIEEKKILVEKNIKLETDLTSEKETTKKLSTEKEYLSGKFELGKLLQTNNIIATGIKSKGSGKEIETNKINRLDKIKVCFETGANKVIDAGDVTLYMRLIGPNGTTITQESMGSGVTKLEDGTDVQYTKSVDFDYQNTSKKICVYWSQNLYTEGKYTAEVYQSGHLIGKTNFVLN
jgi:hypothetical protein